jgi:hypothetical protein
LQTHQTISGRATRGNVSCSGATIATVTVNVSVQMAILFTSSIIAEPIVKIPPAHPENVGGARFVSSCIRYRSDDEFTFHVVD